jgi:hypothetical protein
MPTTASYGVPGSATYSQDLGGLDQMMSALLDNTINQITAKNVRDSSFTLYNIMQNTISANLSTVVAVGNTTSLPIFVGGIQVAGTSSFAKNIQLKSTITDSFGATGPIGYVLSSINGGVSWTQSISSIPSLQQVTNVGATTSNTILVYASDGKLKSRITNFGEIDAAFDLNFAGYRMGLLSSANATVSNSLIYVQNGNILSLTSNLLTTNRLVTLQDKDGVVALLSDVVAAGGSQSLQQVTTYGNSTTQDINLSLGASLLVQDIYGHTISFVRSGVISVYGGSATTGGLYNGGISMFGVKNGGVLDFIYTTPTASYNSQLIFTGSNIQYTWNLPQKSGIVAMLSDITGGGGSQSLQQVLTTGNSSSTTASFYDASVSIFTHGSSYFSVGTYVGGVESMMSINKIATSWAGVGNGPEIGLYCNSQPLIYFRNNGGVSPQVNIQGPTSIATNRTIYVPDNNGTLALASQEYNITSTSSYTPNSIVASRDSTVYLNITAQSGSINFANPNGTWSNNQILIIRILDGGSSAAMSYGTQFRGGMLTLQNATTPGQTLRQEFVYNTSGTITWDLIGQVYN